MGNVEVREVSLTRSHGREHGHGIPDGVAAEQRQRVSLFEAILLHEGGRDLGGGFSDLPPVDALVRRGVCVAGQLMLGVAAEGRGGRVEEPVPYRHICGHFSDTMSEVLLSLACIFASGYSSYGLCLVVVT